jgi:cysteine protease ATG4
LHSSTELAVKVFLDGVIFKDQLFESASSAQVKLSESCSDSSFIVLTESDLDKSFEESDVEEEWGKPVLVLLPLMLGVGKLGQDYYEVVKTALQMPESVGIIGGRPRSALYFVGYQDESLLFLDPHLVQEACTDDMDLLNNLRTYTNKSARIIPLTKVASSMTLGFLFPCQLSFQQFEVRVKESQRELRGLLIVKETAAVGVDRSRSGLEFIEG